LLGRGSGEPQAEVRVVGLDRFVGTAEYLTQERFGPAGLVVTYPDVRALLAALPLLPGSLTASVHATPDDQDATAAVAAALAVRAGRLIMNGWPTGVAVCWAMHHGGPWPATTSTHTSVGTTAIRRWLAPIAYQDWPDELLPPELQRANPLAVDRLVEP
jgi:NADP-dependent aldehyde dehydrogenase